MNVHMHIEYGDAYEAIVLTAPDGKKHRFATGDPSADYARAVVQGMWMAASADCFLMTSSSVNDFVWDVPGYRFNADDLLEIDPADWDADGNLIRKAPDDVD